MVMNSIKLGLATALVIFGGMGFSSSVNAADLKEEMTISPTEKHFEVDPGDTIQDSFIILNSGEVPYDFITYTSPYSVSNGDYSAKYDVDAPRSDAYKWVQMDTPQWHANIRQTVTIPFTIHVPADAAPGGHYGIVFAETKPSGDEVGIVRKKRLGMVLFVKVKGDAVNEGRVSNISIDWFRSRAPIEAFVSIEDNGNTDFVAQTKITVSDLFGGVKYSASNEYNIFPGTNRDIRLSWDDVSWFGLFKVKVDATVMGNTTTRESYVLIAPYWLFILFGLAAVLGAIDVIRRKKHKDARSTR